jgi:hypothetical protein
VLKYDECSCQGLSKKLAVPISKQTLAILPRNSLIYFDVRLSKNSLTLYLINALLYWISLYTI